MLQRKPFPGRLPFHPPGPDNAGSPAAAIHQSTVGIYTPERQSESSELSSAIQNKTCPYEIPHRFSAQSPPVHERICVLLQIAASVEMPGYPA